MVMMQPMAVPAAAAPAAGAAIPAAAVQDAAATEAGGGFGLGSMLKYGLEGYATYAAGKALMGNPGPAIELIHKGGKAINLLSKGSKAAVEAATKASKNGDLAKSVNLLAKGTRAP